MSALTGPARNAVQVQRFLELARNLSQNQLRDIQKAYENPTLGHKDIYLRVGRAPASVDYTALAQGLGIRYRTVFTPDLSTYNKYGPGLEPIAEATSLIARWTSELDLKDFITVYAPVLRSIPLGELGFSDDWMPLAEPARHTPVVVQYEAVLRQNAGARAIRESLLPETRPHITAAICFEAALNPSRRGQLADELVELASFVADSDADLVAATDSAASDAATFEQRRATSTLARIRSQELDLMRWLGTIDVDQLREAGKNLGASAVRIGSDSTLHLAAKSELQLNLAVLAIATAVVTWIVMLVALGGGNLGAWVASFAWAWLGGCGVMFGDSWLINHLPGLFSAVGRSGKLYRSIIYVATALASSAVVAGPWILLVKVFQLPELGAGT